MKKISRVLAVALAAIMLVTLLTACAKNDVRNLIGRFEKSCQDGDAEGLLDCVEPSVSKPIRALSGLVGVKLEDVTDVLIGAANFIGGDSTPIGDILASIRIKPESYVFNKDKDECTVTSTMSYEANGKDESATAVIKCVLDDGGWYIRSIS